ncbi:pollen receptor-like kinase 3 [Andrographis paniculata]|uniref:pollen receptor-like kinase 3 n=1 Tax=Andrographis paniculata TaxID=175694 RepID=UPI0021E9580D|nr:pollen receptor-like kinase 3 [Andrographis paniculata]
MAINPIHGRFLFFFIAIIFPQTAVPNPDSEALLKLKQSFTNAGALDSWQPGTEPCAGQNYWNGVLCENGVVSGLRLGQMGLSGSIDVDALASLPGLRSVAVMSNSFSGEIPGFNRIGALRGLYLSDNQFYGEIAPDYFSNMDGLKKIWLSGNKFSGQIPASVSELSQLMELHLDNNRFSGALPTLDQKSLISLNVSNNNLAGEIPPTLSRFGADAFSGNPGLCGGISGKPCGGKPIAGIVVAILCLLAFIVLLALAIAAILRIRRQPRPGQTNNVDNQPRPVKQHVSISNLVEANSPRVAKKNAGAGVDTRKSNLPESSKRAPRDLVVVNNEKGEFGLSDLMKAAAEVLGNGSLGSSYKATMLNGLSVVVKRVKEMNKLSRDKFDSEMRRLSSLRNKNILPPLAYHYRKDEKLIVSEYQQKGSLMFVLHGDRGIAHAELSWPVRRKIILGIARGLGYLHTELSSLDLPHGDLKSSNILLSTDHEVLLTDYGFSAFTNAGQAAQALMAYKSPEAVVQQHVSPKCDVFCLGIVILEIVTGKFPSQYGGNAQGGADLVQWARSAMAEGREAELADQNVTNTAAGSVNEIVELLRIGAMCTENIPDQRLELGEAIRRIEGVEKRLGG